MRSLRGQVVIGLVAASFGIPAGAQPVMPAGLDLPIRDADGSFETINHGVDPNRTVWHVRAALNVAALYCKGATGTQLVADYNAILKAQRPAFHAADAAIQQDFRASAAGDWQPQYDLYMTRLYNFFSQPMAHEAFCTVASGVSTDARAVPKGGFAGFAPGALARLEEPFLIIYRRYDDYRQSYAAWQRGVSGGAATTTADATPAATPAVAPPAPSLGYGAIDALADPTPPVVPAPAAPAAAAPPQAGAPALAYAPLDGGAAARSSQP